MKSIFSFWLLFVIVSVSISSCSKNDSVTNNCTAQVNPIIINFNVLDKATNQNLYFSPNPRFQTKDLYFFKKIDVARKDTIRPIITGSGTSRYFQYASDYTSLQDTLVLKTGNLSDNTLVYTIEKTDNKCPNYKLATVNFNGSALSPSSERYILIR